MDSDRDYGGQRPPLTRPKGPGLPGPAHAIHPAGPGGPADSAERHAVRRGDGVTVTAAIGTVNGQTIVIKFATSRSTTTSEAMASVPGLTAADDTGGEDDDGPGG